MTVVIHSQANDLFEDGLREEWNVIENINASQAQYGSYVYQANYRITKLEWATTYELEVQAQNEFGWNRPNEPFRFKVLSGMIFSKSL
jgi:hypothetical protein